jgi:adenosylhomocysteine nucleosidase
VSKEHQSRGPVIVVTGLRAEARIAARLPGVHAIAGGGNRQHLEKLVRQAVAQGASGIVSFGIAAGLTPGTAPGLCVVGREVIHEGKRYVAAADWASHLRAAIGNAELAAIAGVDRPLRSPAEKHALHAETGAKAADMESHVAARIAAEHGLPFAALRAIADPAERAVPQAALAGMGQDGRLNVWAVLAALLRAPGQLPAMLRLSGDMQRAMAVLLRGSHRLGPGFGLGDLV